ncbi:MAG: protein kinase [Anaerolineales bacterium]|nr:protein kinase [Anaerolineales bacterium]
MSEKIARYEIRREIGRGGTSTVYLAYDPNFQREVAIKVLHRDPQKNPSLFECFLREARAIASLEHPAIVPVYDFGEDGGRPFLVMRYLSGGSLTERIRRGPFPIAEASRILQRIGGALDAAHAKGIVHRDLKPSNILFDQSGEAYLTDFGIALISETTNSLAGSAVLGTPSYMSPEQIRGESAVDGRADIYALGVVLFEMLTGKTPYEADTPDQVMMMHLADPTPRLTEARDDLPESVNSILIRALAKEPEFRFQNASEMSSVLAAVAAYRNPAGAAYSQTDRILQETSITRVDLEADKKERYGALLQKQAARSIAPKGPSGKRSPAKTGGLIAGGVILIGVLAGGVFLIPQIIPPPPTATPTPTATHAPSPTAVIPLKKTAPADGAFVNTGPILAWNTESGAINYEYCVDQTDNDLCDGPWVSPESASTALLKGLANNGTYYWQVRIQADNRFVYADGGAWWSFTARIQTFADVPIDHPRWEYIEALYAAKYTGGCSTNPVKFCPEDPVTRAQMAIFMLRMKYGADYAPPPATGKVFADVPKDHWAAPYIEQMYAEGITTGCGVNPLIFCPNQEVTRAAFAVFILRTKYGAKYEPPDASHFFTDVPVEGKEWMEEWIDQLYREVSAAACSTDPLMFCPERSPTRAETAELLVREFNIPLPQGF